MAAVLNNSTSDNRPVPRVPVVERDSGLYWHDDNMQLSKRVKMYGSLELEAQGIGQIFPSRQDR